MKKVISIVLVLFLAAAAKSQDFPWVSTADSTRLINSVTYLKNDSDNNVWIGYEFYTESGNYVPKIAKWDGEELTIFSNEDDLEFGVVRSMTSSADGGVWLSTANGVRKLESDGTYTDYPLPQSNEGYRIIDKGGSSNMIELSAGVLFCTTNLYIGKDIYNNRPKLLENKPEIWKLENGNWSKLEIGSIDDINSFDLYEQDDKLLVSYSKLTLIGANNIIGVYNESTNQVNEIELKDFLNGEVKVLANTVGVGVSEYLVSYKPQDLSLLYEGFSLFNTQNQQWRHYGTSVYLSTFPDLDFTPIPSAIYEDSGNYFPMTNYARKITPAKDKGYWMSMESDHKADWFLEKGGGLIYFDGNETFIRYSSDTHEGIKPMRFNFDHQHSSDGRDLALAEWRFGTGVAYDREGNLLVGSLGSGLWMIPKSELPDPNTSVESLQGNNGFVIVPNVVNSGDPLNLSLSNEFEGTITSIYLTDNLGKTISTYSSDQLMSSRRLAISTNNFSTGVYFVNILVDGISMTQKFVIR